MLRAKPKWLILAALVALPALLWLWPADPPMTRWSEAEKRILRSLWLDSLPPLPPAPSNTVADDARAARLGHRLFFDPRLSANGGVSCATCHQPERRFTDGRRRGQAIGRSARNTPSLIGVAYSPWLYWDGRRDSLWSQALTPLEDPAEHGANRQHLARLMVTDPVYRKAYRAVFGEPPDLSDPHRFPPHAGPLGEPEERRAWGAMRAADRERVNTVFANIGKAIGAYERRLTPSPARFDAFVRAVLEDDTSAQLRLYSKEEAAGLRLFIGEARCVECHNGPLLTNNTFHNTGLLPLPGELPDQGRSAGAREVEADPFNCRGEYSDDERRHCPELDYMVSSGDELLGAMRTPSLRNLEGTAPYMHQGQLATLADVLAHYNTAPPAVIGHNEAESLGLSRRQLRQLEAFLRTLAAPPAVEPHWLAPPPERPAHQPPRADS